MSAQHVKQPSPLFDLVITLSAHSLFGLYNLSLSLTMDSARAFVKEETKPEMDTDTGMATSSYMDEDLYEDAGDLEMNNAQQGTYLVKLPKYFWIHLSQASGGKDGRLGTIRVEGSTDNPKRVYYGRFCVSHLQWLTLC